MCVRTPATVECIERRTHKLAGIFPMLDEPELAGLAADIAANGLRQPITLYQDQILDGRNRFTACRRSGVDPIFETYDGDDPLAYVISLNLKRRHLNESQRSLVAAKLVTTGHGGDRSKSQICDLTQARAAELLNVGKRSVEHAAKVRDQGSPELQRAVETGKVPVSLAAIISSADADTQGAVVKRVNVGVKPLEAFRLEKAAKIADRLLKNPTGKYRIIYADPPWSYGNSQPNEFGDARDHYPTMSLQAICDLPVKDWAEDNAVLFLWVTSPILRESFQVVEAWGFEYKASFVWDKLRQVMGHYNGVRHEILLVCTKGQCQPDVRKLFDSVITEKRTEHSRKPAVFYDIIDTIYPNGTRIEMFCRGSGRARTHLVTNSNRLRLLFCRYGLITNQVLYCQQSIEIISVTR